MEKVISKIYNGIMEFYNWYEKFMKIFGKTSVLIFASFVIAYFTGNFPLIASEIKAFNDSELYSKFRGVREGISSEADDRIKTIEAYIENEEYTKAMMELNKILEKKPDNPKIYILSAKLLRKIYQFDEAEKMAKMALERDYKSSDAYLALGYIYFEKAKFSANSEESAENPEITHEYMITSFDHFFMASQYDPQSPYPHIALAEAYYANRQKQRSKDEILKAKELAFSRPEAFYEIGQYYYKINDYEKAKKYIEKSIESGRNKNYRAYYLIGRISEENGDVKKAQQLYLQTLKLKPDMLAAQKRLDALIKTSYKQKMNQKTTSKDLFEDINPDLNLLMRADYYLMLDEYTKARDIYIQLLQKDHQNANAAAGLAELYYSKWKEGFPISKNFTNDALFIMKTEPSVRNQLAFIKFQMINEPKIPEKLRQKLIKLSISETFEFYDLLNEVRAEFLLGNYAECHNKLFKLINLKLSNYEKFNVLKHLCYDHNYYEALIMLDELKKTSYNNREIEPIEQRIMTKFEIVEEKIAEALKLWKDKQYNKSISSYNYVMNYFPTYKSAYLHYALAMEELERYDEAYENLNTYYKLYQLYPDDNPEMTEQEINELMRDIYKKLQQKIKEKSIKN